MELEVHIYHHLQMDAEDQALLPQIIKQYFSIEKELKNITEIQKNIMANQVEIDALTAQVLNNTAGVKEAIVAEAAEIKQAIADSGTDTTKLEAALAANNDLAKLVNDLYTAPGETPPIVVTPPEEVPPSDPQVPEFQQG